MSIETIGVILGWGFLAFCMGAGAVYGLLSHLDEKRQIAKYWDAVHEREQAEREQRI